MGHLRRGRTRVFEPETMMIHGDCVAHRGDTPDDACCGREAPGAFRGNPDVGIPYDRG